MRQNKITHAEAEEAIAGLRFIEAGAQAIVSLYAKHGLIPARMGRLGVCPLMVITEDIHGEDPICQAYLQMASDHFFASIEAGWESWKTTRDLTTVPDPTAYAIGLRAAKLMGLPPLEPY